MYTQSRLFLIVLIACIALVIGGIVQRMHAGVNAVDVKIRSVMETGK